MVAFCEENDVEQRLRRPLTTDESEYLDGMIEEASALVLSYLGCPEDKYEDQVPDGIRLVTSRMVARVIDESGTINSGTFGATQVGATAGPFSHQATFAAGSRTGAPWLTRVDRSMLNQYKCSGKAFSIDTAPRQGVIHRDVCSIYWNNGDIAFCSCGADIAGRPIFEGGEDVP